ncbi:MAG TPA: response regulator [Desulfobacterales bacterium]|nr:response regulator [Desulfobacterales bacterium]
MSVISLFSGVFCKQEAVAAEILEKTGYRKIGDEDVIASASQLSGIPANKIRRAFSGRTSVFNKFTHEKENAIAHLRLALAERLAEDDFLLCGYSLHLVPQKVSHVLRVCLIASVSSRIAEGQAARGVSAKEALRIIRHEDEERAAWVETIHGVKDPWQTDLYDIVVPMDKKAVAQAVALIDEYRVSQAVESTPASRQAVADFRLAAQVEVRLAVEGHDVGVTAAQGVVTLTINKHVLMLNRLEEELTAIVSQIPGVASVQTRVGKDFHQADIYRKFDFQLPSKLLLVDDEREFVETLSERLLMRDMGSAVAYDGETALSLVQEDEPEVMILDLKMPGIDGIQVLRQVKSTRPEIEVIILTGHGSEADREVCMQLGAFAYLQKPVDIDVLSDTLKRANAKIQERKKSAE